jgi:hypothetical protein
MKNAIPKAIAYAKNVNAIENHSFQAWLKEKVEREDLIAWAQREDDRQLKLDDMQEDARWDIIGQLRALIP